MALDRLTQITSSGISSNSTLTVGVVAGVITATSANIEGTLTYDDVTSVDSIGIITARNDVHVGRDLSVTGVSTFQSNVHLLDDDRLQIGGSAGTVDGLEIYHNGSNSYISDSGTGLLYITTNGTEVRINGSGGGEYSGRFINNGAVELYHDNSKKFETTNTGAVVTGILTAGSISVGDKFLNSSGVGLGATDNSGRNAGIGTAIGTLIYNTSSGFVEFYDGINWVPTNQSSSIEATGGTVSEYSEGGVTYKAHVFNSTQPFQISSVPNNSYTNELEYLLVAGGGGGGGASNGPGANAGGGGAGGLLAGVGLTAYVKDYTITIGSGGNGGTGGSTAAKGSNGVDSSISAPGTTTITAIGGGGGGADKNSTRPVCYGNPGGSGGGAGWGLDGSVPEFFAIPVATGTSGQGNPGGVNGYTISSSWGNGGAGGGGGAGSKGDSAPANNYSGGNGGSGLPFSISGTTSSYAGGGGGGQYSGASEGVGGPGGGGSGGPPIAPGAGKNGTVNTGGGGGGGSRISTTGYSGGNGGDGICIIRYRIGNRNLKASGGIITYTATKTIHTFNNSGYFDVIENLTNVDYFMIGAGGAGGSGQGGGGGAGAAKYVTGQSINTGTYSVTIGAGGGATGGYPSPGQGTDGGNTTVTFPSPVTAAGGGGGGSYHDTGNAGRPGGCGGGAGAYGTVPNPGGTGSGDTGGTNNGTSPSNGWGNDGGSIATYADPYAGAGGGGIGGAGQSGASDGPSAGGLGLTFSISGSSVAYGGGGGGGGNAAYTKTNGAGTSGGGNGGFTLARSTTDGTDGSYGTGGGGGGGAWAPGGSSGSPGGSGGSGIFIISYPT